MDILAESHHRYEPNKSTLTGTSSPTSNQLWYLQVDHYFVVHIGFNTSITDAKN